MYPYDFANNSNPQLQNLIAQSLQAQQPAQQASVHTPKVNGRNGADAFYLPPNSDTLVLDMNEAIVWSIQTDSAGYKTVTPFDISPHKEFKPEDKFNQLEQRLKRVEEALNGKSNNPGANWKQQRNDAGNRGDVKGRVPAAVPAESC
jgi:hypothetical protein